VAPNVSVQSSGAKMGLRGSDLTHTYDFSTSYNGYWVSASLDA